jgi:hypothetical protein
MTADPHRTEAHPHTRWPPVPSRHALVLVVLMVAFAGRVIVQLVQRVHPMSWLPSFDQWQSGALPYAVLLAGQLAILGAQFPMLRAVRAGHAVLGERGLRAASVFAHTYLAVMVVRLLVGLTLAAPGGWFDARLPTAFHMLLATFLLVWLDAARPPARPV